MDRLPRTDRLPGEEPADAAEGGARAPVRAVAAWVDGWARSRGTAAPRVVPGGFRIEVGLPHHRARYVLPAADPDVLGALVREIGTPGLWIKVCAPRAVVARALTASWRFSEPQYLMTTPLTRAAAPPPAPPPGYRLDVTRQDGVFEARVLPTSADATPGTPAASGRAALTTGAPGGLRSAVFDMIGTAEEHRRRGLGRLVMAALASSAAEHGARQGVLVASPEGRALYRALGWQLRSPVTEAVFTTETATPG